jgi:hypothetical protein
MIVQNKKQWTPRSLLAAYEAGNRWIAIREDGQAFVGRTKGQAVAESGQPAGYYRQQSGGHLDRLEDYIPMTCAGGVSGRSIAEDDHLTPVAAKEVAQMTMGELARLGWLLVEHWNRNAAKSWS